jgi:hypothetical protein
LIFCSKSHSDFALPYWNPVPSTEDELTKETEWDRLEDRYPKSYVDYMPLNVGDLTVHSGWALHCSNGNDSRHDDDKGAKDRIALAITFVDGDATIRPNWRECGDDEDRVSYESWCQQVQPNRFIQHDSVPIVWPLPPPTPPSSS